MQKSIFILAILLSFNYSFAQDKTKGHLVRTKVVNGDTIPFIAIREVVVFPPKEFKNQRDLKRYRKLVRNIKRVYPYAKLGNIRLIEINNYMTTLETEQEQKKYIKAAEKELLGEFEEELKALTFSQGKLLIKLIDRETGETSYELVKELRGSFSAFMYQSIARIFGANLKKGYDPEGEDKLIEEIILRYENGQL